MLVLEPGLGEARELVDCLNREQLDAVLVAAPRDLLRPAARQRHRWPILIGGASALYDLFAGDDAGLVDPLDIMLVVDSETQPSAVQALGHMRPYCLWRDEGMAALAARVADYVKTAEACRRRKTVQMAAAICRRLADDPDYTALIHLYRADGNSLSLTRLSLDSGINLSTLRRIIDRLEARDLLHIAQGANGDGRVREVILTANGSHAVESSIPLS